MHINKWIFFLLFHFGGSLFLLSEKEIPQILAKIIRKNNDSLPNSLKHSWKKYKNNKFLHESQDISFLYALGCHQLENSSDGLADVISVLKKNNNKYSIVNDVLLKYFFVNARIDDLKNLHLLKNDLSTDQLSLLDRDSALILLRTLFFLRRKNDLNKVINHLEKMFGSEEHVIYPIILLHVESGEYEIALNKLNDFLSKHILRSKHVSFLLLKASLLENAQKLDDALDVVNLALNLTGEFNEKILRYKVKLLSVLQKKDDLFECLSKLSKASDDFEIKKTLINLYIQESKFVEALEEIEQCEENSKEIFLKKISLQMQLGLPEQALETLNRFLNSKYAVFSSELKNLKYSLLHINQKYDALFDEVFVDFKKSNFNSNIFSQLMALALKCKEKQKIINNLLECFQKKSDHVYFQMLLADFCQNEGFYSEALRLYEVLDDHLKCDQKMYAKLLVGRSRALFFLGNDYLAKHLLNDLLNHNNYVLPAFELAAEMELKSGNYFKAISFCEKGLRIVPTSYSLNLIRKNILQKIFKQKKNLFCKLLCTKFLKIEHFISLHFY